jgi:cell shape-determining protein MreC
MSSSQFNQFFAVIVLLALVGAIVVPQSITQRAQGKADVLLWPVVRPVRAIAAKIHGRVAGKQLPPGETQPRTDADLAAENSQLRQQVTFLTRQLVELKLVEAERKKLGSLLEYFKPVGVIGGDASPTRESLNIMPASGVDTSLNAPVMYSDGLAGKFVEGRRVRLVTDRESTIAADFGRMDNGQLVPIGVPKASVRGIGGGAMRVDNLTVKEAENIRIGDMLLVSDTIDLPAIVQGRPMGLVESIRPLPSKPLYAEIIIKPRFDLRKLREVLLLRK